MQSYAPEAYNFFPETFILPGDMDEFYTAVFRGGGPFIVKPSNDCQGRGIHIVNEWDDFIDETDDRAAGQVAQAYIDDPLTIDDLKFDLRLYVVIAGVHPLRVYIYGDGMARFATRPYKSALDEESMNDLFVHLTNYSINKHNVDYKKNEMDGGTGGQGHESEDEELSHKRSFKEIMGLIKQKFGDNATNKLMADIEDLIVKTCITGAP